MLFGLTEATMERWFPLPFWCLNQSLKKWWCGILSDGRVVNIAIIINVTRLDRRSIHHSWSLSWQTGLQMLSRLLAFKCWLIFDFWESFPLFPHRKILHLILVIILCFFNICYTKLFIVHFIIANLHIRQWIWSIFERWRYKNGRLSHDYVINLAILVGETCQEINFIYNLFRCFTQFDLDLMMRWLFLNHILVLYINILVFSFCILLLYIFNISWLRTIFDLFFHLLIIIKRKRLRRSFFVQYCLNDYRGTIRFCQLRCGSSCSL